MTSAHTPGPWTWEKPVPLTTGNESRCLSAGDGADPILRHEAINWTVTDANARLIAAAPTLLEALESVVSECEQAPGSEWDPDTIKRARAAIAAAREGTVTP